MTDEQKATVAGLKMVCQQLQWDNPELTETQDKWLYSAYTSIQGLQQELLDASDGESE